MLFSDSGFVVRRATKYVPDERATHYWDQQGKLVETYRHVLGIDGPAWDVYLLYDRDAEWHATPPAPADWMEQLGIYPARALDAGKLAGEVRRLIERK